MRSLHERNERYDIFDGHHRVILLHTFDERTDGGYGSPKTESPTFSDSRNPMLSARSGKPRQAGKRQEDTGMNALHFGMRTRLSKSFNVSIEMGSFGSQNNRLGVAILDRNIKQIGPPPSARKN